MDVLSALPRDRKIRIQGLLAGFAAGSCVWVGRLRGDLSARGDGATGGSAGRGVRKRSWSFAPTHRPTLVFPPVLAACGVPGVVA